MKKSMISVIAGAALLGGCTYEVMDEGAYRPLAQGSETPAVAADNGAANAASIPAPENDLQPASTAPAASTASTASTAPARSEVKYAPMEADNSPRGITSPVGSKKGATASATAPAAAGEYVVKSGDTMGKIAYRHHVSLKSLLAANNMTLEQANKIRVGTKIVIPGAAAASSTAAASGSASAAASTAAVGTDGMYVVKAGDNIPKIARRLGVRASDLQKANNLSDEATRRLQVGQKLVVPGRSSATTASAASTAAASAPAVKETPKTAPAESASAASYSAPAPAPAKPADDLDKLVDNVSSAPAAPAESVSAGAEAPASELSDSTPDVVLEDSISLEDYAKKHNTTVEMLRKLNSDIGDTLKKDQVVFVPTAR